MTKHQKLVAINSALFDHFILVLKTAAETPVGDPAWETRYSQSPAGDLIALIPSPLFMELINQVQGETEIVFKHDAYKALVDATEGEIPLSSRHVRRSYVTTDVSIWVKRAPTFYMSATMKVEVVYIYEEQTWKPLTIALAGRKTS